jgi:hypothetical protein
MIKIFIKKIIGFILFKFILLFKRNYIFCYHEITDKPSKFQTDYNLFVEKKIFFKQINWMLKYLKFISPFSLNMNFHVNTALLTFDDGYYGSFINPNKFLKKNGISAIYFINFNNLLDFKKPLINSFSSYLEKKKLVKEKNLYLSINKDKIKKIKIDEFILKKIRFYQGKLIDIKSLKKIIYKSNLFFLGNHLFEHYNSLAINDIFFQRLYDKNHQLIKKFSQKSNFFAFPNGKINSGYNNNKIYFIKKKYNNTLIFTIDGKSNLQVKKNNIFHRIVIDNNDSINLLKYKIVRSFI